MLIINMIISTSKCEREMIKDISVIRLIVATFIKKGKTAQGV